MGKKKSRTSQTSKGERRSLARDVVKATRRDYMKSGKRGINQLAAFMRGKNVMLTIENPNKNETNKRFIRVPANTVWRNFSRK
tara:strand:+ start:1305 stop:1553 length:249 start_codon:yes stop_codon:yes gene_type:complete